MQNVYFPSICSENSPSKDFKESNLSRKRNDGRSSDDLRNMFFKCGVSRKAAGSAYVELHHTKVQCAVYGPHSTTGTRYRREYCDQGQLFCEVRYSPFAQTKRREKKMDADEIEMSKIVKEAVGAAVFLEKLPKCVISVYIKIIEADGGETGSAIMAASLALADAGIEMYDLVTCCTAGMINDEIVLDPTSEEEKCSKDYVEILVAYMPSHDEVSHVLQKGKLEFSKVQEGISLCIDGCAGPILSKMRSALVERE